MAARQAYVDGDIIATSRLVDRVQRLVDVPHEMHNESQGVPFHVVCCRASQNVSIFFSAPNACRTSASIFGFRGPWQNSMRPNIWQASKRPAALSVGAAQQVYGCVPNDEEIGAHVRAFLWPDGTGVFRAEFPNKSSLVVH